MLFRNLQRGTAILWDLDTCSARNGSLQVRLVTFCVAVLYGLTISVTDFIVFERNIDINPAVVRRNPGARPNGNHWCSRKN